MDIVGWVFLVLIIVGAIWMVACDGSKDARTWDMEAHDREVTGKE